VFSPSQTTNYFSIRTGSGMPPSGPSKDNNLRMVGGFGLQTAGSHNKRSSQRNSMFHLTDHSIGGTSHGLNRGEMGMFKTQQNFSSTIDGNTIALEARQSQSPKKKPTSSGPTYTMTV